MVRSPSPANYSQDRPKFCARIRHRAPKNGPSSIITIGSILVFSKTLDRIIYNRLNIDHSTVCDQMTAGCDTENLDSGIKNAQMENNILII